MSDSKRNKRMDRVLASAEALFGQKAERISAPGGKSRASYRIHFKDRNVVATLRPNFRRTHLEAYALRTLAGLCDDTPECLGVDGEILFQSDVGKRRLNLEIAASDPGRRVDLAAEAVASIFRIQAAGRQAGLDAVLPHLGQNREWIENVVDGPDELEDILGRPASDRDKDQLCEALSVPATQFVKWDCRSGNAALDDNEALRWFDFEYAGIRHGAEDLAWLIGDEVWPIAPEDMERIVTDQFDTTGHHALEEYLNYLALYTAFHCVQRLNLIVRQAQKHDWLSKKQIRKADNVGTHPEFALQLCQVGRYFADRNAMSRPLVTDFEAAEDVFLSVLREGLAQEPVLAAC